MAGNELTKTLFPITEFSFREYKSDSAEEKILSEILADFYKNGRVIKKHEPHKNAKTGEISTVSCEIVSGERFYFRIKRGKNVTALSKKLDMNVYAVEIYSDDSSIVKSFVFSGECRLLRVFYFGVGKTPECEIFFCSKNKGRELLCKESNKEITPLYPVDGLTPNNINEVLSAANAKIAAAAKTLDGTEYYALYDEKSKIESYFESLNPVSTFVPNKDGFGFEPDCLTYGYVPKSDLVREKIGIAEDEKSGIDIQDEKTSISQENAEHSGVVSPAQALGVSEQTENTVEADASNNADDKSREASLSIGDNKNFPDAQEAMDRTVPKPSCVINASKDKYLYYGDIDENGDRSGVGITTLADSGSIIYYGGYCCDKRSNIGAYYYKNGKPSYFGDWNDNRRNGIGIAYRSNGSEIHAGSWKDDKAQGIGVRFDSDGSFKYLANFSDGKRDGVSVSFNSAGNLVVTLWKDGKQLPEKRIIDLDDF